MKKIVLFIFALLFFTEAHAQYSPTGASPTSTPAFTWPSVPGATSYTHYIAQYGPDTVVNLTPLQVGCAAGGTCTYNPGVTCSAPAQQGQGVCSQGHTIAWWIEAYSGSKLLNTSGELMAYIPIAGGGSGNYNTNVDNDFDDQPCTKWFYVKDFVGQTRRVIDFSIGSGTQSLGTQMFHKDAWTPVDISDLVPPTARAARIELMTIYTATCAAIYPCDLLAWTVRRNGTSEIVPNQAMKYTTSSRSYQELTVPLNNGKFDFYWSNTAANGINVAHDNASTVTGEAMNATLIGYCTP